MMPLLRRLRGPLFVLASLGLLACAPSPVERCRTSCERTAECVPITAGLLESCRGRCVSTGGSAVADRNLEECRNRAEIESAIDRCNSLPCSQWGGCVGGIPVCQR